jgi:hypothetical protein
MSPQSALDWRSSKLAPSWLINLAVSLIVAWSNVSMYAFSAGLLPFCCDALLLLLLLLLPSLLLPSDAAAASSAPTGPESSSFASLSVCTVKVRLQLGRRRSKRTT